jgi:hypothetical protein
MKAAIKPSPRTTPIAIPAFAPPLSPLEPATEVADGEADDVWVVLLSKPGIESDGDEVAVEKVVGVVLSAVVSMVIGWVGSVVTPVIVGSASVVVGLGPLACFGCGSSVVVATSGGGGRVCPMGAPTP